MKESYNTTVIKSDFKKHERLKAKREKKPMLDKNSLSSTHEPRS